MVAKIIPETRKCLVCPNTFLVGGTGNGLRSKKYCSRVCAGVGGGKKPAVLSNELTELDRAYLAGMFDADGHVGIYGRNTGPQGYARVRLDISNTDFELLGWIQEITGIGSIQRKRPLNERYKPGGNWITSSEAAVSVLQQLLPYMRVKRARAELAIEYQVGLKDARNRADLAWREGYREKMLKMNKRGPVAA